MRRRDPFAALVSPFAPQKQRFFRRAKDDTEKMSVHWQMFASFVTFNGIMLGFRIGIMRHNGWFSRFEHGFYRHLQ